nr:hypothetical protein [Tanacetum cinerariifolium]
MSRDIITVGSTMRIPLLYRGEYSQWRDRFMNYLEEQIDGKAMINSIQNGDQPLPVITQVSLAGTAQNVPPILKDPNNETAKDLWDALERQMRGSGYGEQDRKATILYEYETFKAIEGEQLLDTYLRSGSDDFSELKKITSLLAKAFNRRKFYSKPTNNNLRTSSTSQSANKKQEFIKIDNKKVEKKDDEKKRDMSRVKCYNFKKEGHFTKDCKKVKVKDYEYYKTKMLFAKKDKDEQVLLAKDQAWMESTSDSDQEINANMEVYASLRFRSDQYVSGFIGPVHIWLSKVEPLLVAFDSQLKIFHTSLNDDASCKHPKRDVKSESFLNAMPFHNLEICDSNDPPLGVYIESRFLVNSEPVELLTFPPPVRDSLKGVLVIVYRLLGTSPKILEVVVDEVCKGNYTTTSIIRYQRKRL